jgi:hypothetical protein
MERFLGMILFVLFNKILGEVKFKKQEEYT